MGNYNFSEVALEMEQLLRRTGAFIRNSRPDHTKTQVKGKNDFATEIDLAAEKLLAQGLQALIPEAAMLAEEGTEATGAGTDFRWIIDPIDGTTNFIYGLPCFAISVALEVQGALKLGAVYEISRDEYFSAIADGPALLNGNPIAIGKATKLEDALIATGFPYQNEAWLQNWIEIFKDVQRSSRGIRRWGAAAVDLAYVACGRFDGYFEYGLNPWDCAAGALIVERAGGMVANFAGEDGRVAAAGAADRAVFQRQLIAGNKLVVAELIKKVATMA